MSLELLSLDNPVFKSYTFWAGVLVIKMFAMSLLTAIQRFKTKVSARGHHLWPDWVKVRSKSWVKASRDCRDSFAFHAYVTYVCSMTQHIFIVADIRQS